MPRTVIWKYELTVMTRQKVPLPEGAKVLALQVQGPFVLMWAAVQSTADTKERLISMYETGVALEENKGEYLGTIRTPVGNVWHVFVGDE